MATALDMQILEDGSLSPTSGSDLGGGQHRRQEN